MRLREKKYNILFFLVLFLVACSFCAYTHNNSYAFSSTSEIKYESKNGSEFDPYDSLNEFNKLIIKAKNSHSRIIDVDRDYNLQGDIIELPANCVLRFSGGILSNGTLYGHNTCIEAPITVIFGKDIHISKMIIDHIIIIA